MRATPAPGDRPLERTLRNIETRVLDDIWLPTPARLAIGSAAGSMCVTAVLVFDSRFIPLAATVMFGAAAVLSLIALTRLRFRWSCAAAYGCGLATVIGSGAFWWQHTGHAPQSLFALAVGAGLAAALTVAWLRVILTPLARSQPDLRSGIR